MKATPSKDGAMRFTIRVEHRMGAEDIVDAFCFRFMRDHYEHNVPNPAMQIESALKAYRSRKAIMDVVLRTLHDEGSTYWTWHEQHPESYCDILREQVRVLVAKKFPELKSNR
jgi:hypothetical protein